MDQHHTITQALLHARRRPRHWIATRHRHRDLWLNSSWDEVFHSCEAIGGALLHFGVQAGERVALVAETRREWLFADLGIMGMGAITVPIYPSQRAEDLSFIVRDSQAKVLILENLIQWRKWTEVQAQCPSVTKVVVIDDHRDLPSEVCRWEDFIEHGHEYGKAHPRFFEERIHSHAPSDWATLIYTSGTTGEPKGVVLTHQQIMGEVAAVAGLIPLSEKDTSLTFLPYAHVLGRMESWAAIAVGFTLAFAENIDRLRSNLLEIQPTFLIAVPRIFEKLYAAILSQAEANPAVQKLFSWGLSVGGKVSELRRERRALSPQLLTKNLLAQRLVFRAIHKKLGGRLRFAVSGGAPLAAEIAQFFHSIGILILEGYGLTETTGAITANSPLAYKFGSVGRALKGVEIKIADDGEILVKGPMLMKEYYQHPDATRTAMPNSFFHTGDIGELDSEGFLKITDRKKDLIKTAGGKYIAPQKLENLLKMNPLISQVLIYGDQAKYVVAVITLNAEKAFQYARTHEISHQDLATLGQHPQIKAVIRSAVAEVNAKLSSYETIKNFAILSHDFTVEAGEITPSLKVRRKFCSQKYADLIQSLYD